MNKKKLPGLLIFLVILVAAYFITAMDTGTPEQPDDPGNAEYTAYTFRNDRLLEEHFNKHGIEMGFSDKEAYEQAASDAANNPDALHKLEKEDGDDVYYVEETNEFVVVSKDGFIRTYFCPDSGIKYYDKQ